MIALTDSAASKVRQLIEAEGDPGLALRVEVHPGGCSGFSYDMYFDSEVTPQDQTADFSGVKVVTDPSSAQLLAGATLDYRDTDGEVGFSIVNPNSTGHSCTCGNGGH